MEHFIPYHYESITVPLDPDGLLVEDPHQYIEWLADYLHDNDCTLSPDQVKWMKEQGQSSPKHIIFVLSDVMGLNEGERDRIIFAIKENESYKEILNDEKEQWESCLTGDPDLDDPFEKCCLTREEFKRIKREVLQEDTIGDLPGEADIPVRGIIKAAIDKCGSRKERIKIIQLFFDNYNSMASK